MHRNHPQRRMTLHIADQPLAQHTTVASELHCHRRDAETSGQTLRWRRPETHQNLIHPDKDPSSSLDPRIGATNWRHLRHLRSRSGMAKCRLLSLLRDTFSP